MNQNQKPLQLPIESDEQLEDILCSKGLKVIEIYSEWSGPCKSILPTFKRVRQEKEDENALQFFLLKAEQSDFLESVVAVRGCSEPLFLLYRNGACKKAIEGADTPKLNNCIIEFTPANPEADDLEENSFYINRKERLKKSGL